MAEAGYLRATFENAQIKRLKRDRVAAVSLALAALWAKNLRKRARFSKAHILEVFRWHRELGPEGTIILDCMPGFSNAMNFDYTMTFSDDRSLQIAVFPVYHPEYYAHVKNGAAIQKQVWERIAGRLNHLDDRIIQELQTE